MFFPDEDQLKFMIDSGEIIDFTIKSDRDKSISMYLKLQIDSTKTAEVLFDTGTTFDNIILNTRYLELLNIDTTATSVKKETYKSIFGKMESTYEANVPHLKIIGSSESINDKMVTFKKDLIYDGLIGAGAFRNSIITIDILSRRLIINKSEKVGF